MPRAWIGAFSSPWTAGLARGAGYIGAIGGMALQSEREQIIGLQVESPLFYTVGLHIRISGYGSCIASGGHDMNAEEKVTADHLRKQAIVYVRQSTLHVSV